MEINMITISLCMIVKNEEEVLERCLNSLKGLMDEIIIVDTGSTDSTKEIAARYTDKIYDFSWCDDFAAARNFSFSKATQEYIYAPDADEVLDDTNRRRFMMLKAALLPEIEIVQMKYITPSKFNTVQNSSSEYRPKLFKRLRTFTWINPVHETVRFSQRGPAAILVQVAGDGGHVQSLTVRGHALSQRSGSLGQAGDAILVD